MLDYMTGSENPKNGMLCYYGDEEILEHTKRKLEEGDEGFDKGSRKKRYILGQNVGKWTEEEHNRFVLALKKFGRNWTLVQQEVKTRTLVQIRSHAQKYFLKKVRGIAPSNITMDSKLISTASDGIVPTWLLQDDSNYANKSSVNTNINSLKLSSCDKSNISSNSSNSINNDSGNHGRLTNESNCNRSTVCNAGSNLNNGIGLHNMNIQTKTLENNIYHIYGQGSNSDNTVDDNIELGCGIDIAENDGIGMSRKLLDNIPNDHISYGGISNSSSTSLLIDDYNRDCFSYQNNEYKDDYLNENSEIEDIKYDHKNIFDSKKIINDCSTDKNASLESNSMFSTAVSSPASLCPEKSYIPASIMLDTLLMPPTVDIDNNLSQHDFQVNFYNTRSETNVKSDCDNNNNLNYCFNDNERIINPHISLCDVPWPITGCDQFLNFNENSVSSTPSPSPSSSSSISYFDLDASGSDSKRFSNDELFSPNKHYEMNNSLSDFVYCGDSLGIDILNTYNNYRDTTNPIINTSDVNYII
ncbi:Myb domain containing [Cryptosporidium xiaoi]|uniref:Myb domain containing n=1 Tax=Cryptosporidium xiaoi TaxID=659607 RepID=A0AAV9Y396_9CRYT